MKGGVGVVAVYDVKALEQVLIDFVMVKPRPFILAG